METKTEGIHHHDSTPKRKGRPKKAGFKGIQKKGEVTIVPKKLVEQCDDIKSSVESNTESDSGYINTNLSDLKNCVFEKITIIESDILALKCDAIVNAAKTSLLGGGGIDGIIHKAAGGDKLKKKCEALPIVGRDETGNEIRCHIGECVVTDTLDTNLEKDFDYIFHTVGPDCGSQKDMTLNHKRLENCYKDVLRKVQQYEVKSIAFCCISTGIYGFPKKDAASIAFQVVMPWLEKNYDSIDEIVFCMKKGEGNMEIYSKLLHDYKVKIKKIAKGEGDNDIDREMDSKKANLTMSGNQIDEQLPTCSKFAANDRIDIQTLGTSTNEDSTMTMTIVDEPNDATSQKVLLTENVPVPLRNIIGKGKENICFFNSVVQVLYSLLPFRSHVYNNTIENPYVKTIKRLFKMMDKRPSNPINTYKMVPDLNFRDYNHKEGHQIDSREVLLFIIDNIFHEDQSVPLYSHSNYGIFKLTESRKFTCDCGNVRNSPGNSIPNLMLDVNTVNTSHWQTIDGLLSEHIDVEGLLLKGYRCEGCGVENKTISTPNLSVDGDFMILILNLFDPGTAFKKTPDIKIDHVIDRDSFGVFELQGIIWHGGPYRRSGHYECDVKVNGEWYHANDAIIKKSNPRFRSCLSQNIIPYIIVYKKRSSNNNCFTKRIPYDTNSFNGSATYSAGSHDIDFEVHKENSARCNQDASEPAWSVPKRVAKNVFLRKKTPVGTSNRYDCLSDEERSGFEDIFTTPKKVAKNISNTKSETSNKFEVFGKQVDDLITADKELLVSDDKSLNGSENVKKKSNLKRRRTVFAPKRERNPKKMREFDRERQDKVRSTQEGKEKNRLNFENFTSTPEGKEKNRLGAKVGMSTIRATREGKEKNRSNFKKFTSTLKGKEKNRQNSQNVRNEKITTMQEIHNNERFPPTFHNYANIQKHCIDKFKDATSDNKLKRKECGVCGVSVKKGDYQVRLIR